MNTTIQTSEQPNPTKRKGYRLFKRDASNTRELSPEEPGWRDRPYFFKFQFRGKTYPRCLETTDSVEAQKRARLKAHEIKDAIVRGEFDRLKHTKMRTAVVATVKEILEAYDVAPGDASESTRRQNVNALKQLLRTAHGEATAVETLSAAEINSGLVQTWFKHCTARAAAASEQSEQVSIKKSANSRIVQASSLFTDRVRAYYASQDIDHPAFTEFVRAGHVHRFSRLPKDQYNPPSDAIIKATLEAWEAIQDRNLFLAIGHELAFGLRLAEIAQATWQWWTTREGYPVLDDTAWVKNGTGFIQVRALDPWFSIMRDRIAARGWRGEPSDFIITGSATFRKDDIFRAVSGWLRDLKWHTTKTNHALRAYAGSQVAMRYGIYEAQCWLRHSTVKVTEQHYTHFVKRFRPADPDTIAARWATVQPQAPQLHILPTPAA
jgi:integrase